MSQEQAWLQVLYVEAWKQYTLEDNISQRRSNLFLVVQAGLIAILTGVSGWLVRIEPIELGSDRLWVGPILLGVIAVVIAAFVIRLLGYWREVTRAGQVWQKLRWVAIRRIEKEADLCSVTLAGLEKDWIEFSRQNSGREYFPFPDFEELKHDAIPPAVKIEGWQSTLRVIAMVQAFWYVILGIGLALVAVPAVLGLFT